MNEEKPKKSKLDQFLFDQGLSLKDAERITGICYPTLENIKFNRPINYRQRTLRDVAAFCKCTVDELIDRKEEVKYNTVFDKALSELSKKRGIHITMQDIHEATGVSMPILTALRKGGKVRSRKRTIRDVAQFLEISVEELWNNDISIETTNK